MKDLIKPIYDTIKKDPRKMGVTAPKKEEKPGFFKRLRIGGVILALLTLGLSFLLKKRSKDEEVEEDDEDYDDYEDDEY